MSRNERYSQALEKMSGLTIEELMAPADELRTLYEARNGAPQRLGGNDVLSLTHNEIEEMLNSKSF